VFALEGQATVPIPRPGDRAKGRAFRKAIDTAKEEAVSAVAKEDFAAAMRAMAKLRPRHPTVADLSRIEG
jgi:hypothetical protein